MAEKNYHHGDLKNALIEAGIEMINETGVEQLSLRKVAVRCGVSNAAPYAHFTGKEEMIQAMQEHVTKSFMERLQNACEPFVKKGETDSALIAMGREYVLFFLDHPAYFPFLFSQPCMRVNLSLEKESKDDFSPYQLMRKIVIQWSNEQNPKLSDYDVETRLIHMWATVHGIASIAMMKNVTWNQKWENELERLIF